MASVKLGCDESSCQKRVIAPGPGQSNCENDEELPNYDVMTLSTPRIN